MDGDKVLETRSVTVTSTGMRLQQHGIYIEVSAADLEKLRQAGLRIYGTEITFTVAARKK